MDDMSDTAPHTEMATPVHVTGRKARVTWIPHDSAALVSSATSSGCTRWHSSAVKRWRPEAVCSCAAARLESPGKLRIVTHSGLSAPSLQQGWNERDVLCWHSSACFSALGTS